MVELREPEVPTRKWTQVLLHADAICNVVTVPGSQYVGIELYPAHEGNYPGMMFQIKHTLAQAEQLRHWLIHDNTGPRRAMKHDGVADSQGMPVPFHTEWFNLTVVMSPDDCKAIAQHIQSAIAHAAFTRY